MGTLFGTDGIRARAGEFPLDAATVPVIGRAIAARLGGPILLGEDPRESSPWIRDLLRRGMEAAGVEVRDAGILPTPGLALLTQQSDAAGGVMISASHNPFQDNGIKVFRADGRKLEDSDESRIEAALARPEPAAGLQAAGSTEVRPSAGISSWAERYLDLLRSRFRGGRWLAGMRIGVDCANGATSALAPALLESFGARVETIHARPSGRNINAGCGAVHPGSLVEAARTNAWDLGVAYDGDGDRSMFVSPAGRLIDGDGVLLVMARALKERARLEPALVIGTSMTNYNLEKQLKTEGIELVRVDVGDRYVFQKMLETGAPLGGEPSGHIIFPDFRLSGDGLLTTLKLCEVLVQQGDTLDAATRDWKPAPQLLENLRVREKLPLDSLPGLSDEIRRVQSRLEGRGRMVVRYSGTEALLRIMIESDSGALNTECAAALAGRIREAMGIRPEVLNDPVRNDA